MTEFNDASDDIRSTVWQLMDQKHRKEQKKDEKRLKERLKEKLVVRNEMNKSMGDRMEKLIYKSVNHFCSSYW